MASFFMFQVLISFVVGGLFISALSIFAEKTNKKAAGIILSLPSTVLVSYFFIGWTLSPQAVAKIVPVTIAGTGLVLIFATTYLYLSKVAIPKVASMFISSVFGLLVWFVGAIPLAIFKFSSLTTALLVYVPITLGGYYFLTLKPKFTTPAKKPEYSLREKIGRALFGGTIIALAVCLAKILSPFWGGIFSGFPALFFSTLIILHRNHNSEYLFRTFHNVPFGLLVTISFPLAAGYTYPTFGIILGSVIAYFVSIIVGLGVYKVTNKNKQLNLQ